LSPRLRAKVATSSWCGSAEVSSSSRVRDGARRHRQPEGVGQLGDQDLGDQGRRAVGRAAQLDQPSRAVVGADHHRPRAAPGGALDPEAAMAGQHGATIAQAWIGGPRARRRSRRGASAAP
jgi:hypothetical protein